MKIGRVGDGIGAEWRRREGGEGGSFCASSFVVGLIEVFSRGGSFFGMDVVSERCFLFLFFLFYFWFVCFDQNASR